MAPVAIRFNNPGAINVASWVMALPGYTGAKETTPGNRTASFSTPGYGVAAYWELLHRYRLRGITTIGGIVTQYGGGQDYSAYLRFVCERTHFKPSQVIDLYDDKVLLPFARAQFSYEAGLTMPLTDTQILNGFSIARRQTPGGRQGWAALIISLISKLFKKKT